MTTTSSSATRVPRPRKKASKTELIQFRVTDGELRIIQQAAGHDSASIAGWTRATLLKRADELVAAAKGSLRGRGYLPLSADVLIEPGHTAQITARPQVSFCPDRLVVSRRSADFTIHEMMVARHPIGVQAGNIPAEPFCADLDNLATIEAELESKGVVRISLATITALDSLGQTLAFPRCAPGMDISIIATNESDKPTRFSAVLFGAL
jgi:hypothetical protein